MMHRMIVRSGIVLAFLSLSGFGYAPLLQAQAQSRSPSTTQSAQPAPPPRKTVSDKELQAFAKAYIEIQKIKETHQSSAPAGGQNPAQTQQLEQKTNAEMTKAVEKQGLTPESYTQVLAAVNSDKTLQQKALDLIKKEKAE